jgi:hypothetical protein
METDQGLHHQIVKGAKFKFLTLWLNRGLGPQKYSIRSISPVFIQPLSIKLNNPLPNKLPITTSFLLKKVITLNDRLLFIWKWQSLDSNSGCHATVHICVCVCVCVCARAQARACVCMYVFMHVYMYVCIYICMYLCMCVWV